MFDPGHKDGGPKAKFLIEELGFDPEDWRFLAAQFYDGLLLSEPRDLELRHWGSGYGAKFNTYVQVTSRSGKSGVLRTGWMLEPEKLPKLSTAFPDRPENGVIKPPIPPVLEPARRDDDWWSNLYDLAHQQGEAAHAVTLPTPLFLQEFDVIEEGECGSSSIHVADARTGFARWLIKTGKGYHGYKGGAQAPCPIASQSADRAEAYANGFARVLALNGISASVETRYT